MDLITFKIHDPHRPETNIGIQKHWIKVPVVWAENGGPHFTGPVTLLKTTIKIYYFGQQNL